MRYLDNRTIFQPFRYSDISPFSFLTVFVISLAAILLPGFDPPLPIAAHTEIPPAAAATR